MLCIGSSLTVYPVAGLPQLTQANGGRVVLVTEGDTPYDARGRAQARRRRGGGARGRARRALVSVDRVFSDVYVPPPSLSRGGEHADHTGTEDRRTHGRQVRRPRLDRGPVHDRRRGHRRRASRWSSIRCRRAGWPRRCTGTPARTSTASSSRGGWARCSATRSSTPSRATWCSSRATSGTPSGTRATSRPGSSRSSRRPASSSSSPSSARPEAPRSRPTRRRCGPGGRVRARDRHGERARPVRALRRVVRAGAAQS